MAPGVADPRFETWSSASRAKWRGPADAAVRRPANAAAGEVDDEIGRLAVDFLQQSDYPLFLLDAGDGEMIWANAAATELLGEATFLCATGARLAPVDRAQTADFLAYLGAEETRSSWLVLAPEGGRGLVLNKATLRNARGRRRVMVWACSPRRREEIDPDLSRLFGLTPAESKVLRLLCAGHSAEGVTHIVGASMETVRTHVRRIYGKMGVACREELFFLVQQYRAF